VGSHFDIPESKIIPFLASPKPGEGGLIFSDHVKCVFGLAVTGKFGDEKGYDIIFV